MTMAKRVLLATAILAVDLVAIFVPLTALMVAYVILFNPPWVKKFLNSLVGPSRP